MIEADEANTWVQGLCRCHFECCARPTGEDMVVPLETSRNAQPDKVKAAPNAVGKGEIARPRPV
jgi:hypothetical protein